MTLDQKLEKVKNLLEQIQKVYDGLGDTNPFQGIDPNTIAASNKEIDKLEIALTGITKNASDLEKGFGGIAASIGASLAEMNKQNNVTNRTVKAMRGLSSISESLKHDQSGLSKLSLKELESKRDKAKILSQEARTQAVLVKQKYEAMTSDKNGNQLYGAALDARLEKLIRNKTISKSELQTINEIIAAEKEKFPVLDELNAKIEERIQKEKKINRTLGFTKVALEGLGKIPIVGPLLDTNKALDAARTKAEAGGNALQSMGAAIGSMSKSLVSSFTDPLVVIGLLVKGFQMFLDIGFAADKQITDLSKSMAVSHEEATATRDRFIEIQNSGESIFNTTKNLVAAQMELADALGATRGFTEQQVKDQVMLTKEMGFSAEASEGIQKLAMANSMTAEDVTDSIIKQTSALAKQTGIQLDNKQIAEKVAKVSGQLRLQYKNNPALIAKAVVQTEKLGISLETAANAAKGLLDFESSIENELAAELLTGKALNLERARGLALNGDAAGAAEEMLAQVGSAADFANMNAIQQEAIAKAIGMSTDDLANSLVTQENLKKLGNETRSQVEEQIEAAKALGDTDKVRMLEASIGNEKEAQIALKKISAQDKLNAAVDTMKAMLASILEGPAAGLINWIGKLAGDAKRLKSIFETVKSTLKGLARLALAKLAINVYASLATIPVVGPALGLVAGAAAFAWGNSLIPSFEEGGIVQGSSYKGDNVKANVNSGEMILNGSQQKNLFDIANNKDIKGNNNQDLSALPQAINGLRINKKDNIIAETNPGSRDNNNQDSSALIQAINGLRSDMKVLASRPINTSVQLDGKELVLAQGTYSKEKGDANRMESWQMS
jgi:hypothetical protein